MTNQHTAKFINKSAQIIPLVGANNGALDIRSLVLKDQKGYQIIPHKDVIHCEADGNYTIVYTHQGQQFVTCKTLKAIEKKLPQQLFIRVHQSHLVALDAIRGIDLDQNIRLLNGKQLPLARRAKANVYQALGIK